MEIGKTQNGETLVLSLSGRLDTTTAPELQEVLIPAFDASKQIELDLTELLYISSAGLRVLLTGQKTAKAKAAAMTVSNVSEEIMEVFEMTGFADMLTIL